VFGFFGRAINWFFLIGLLGLWTVRQGYARSLSFLVRIRVIVLAVVALLVVTGWLYVPTGFPEQIKAISSVLFKASLNYTNDIMRRVETELLKLPETRQLFAIGGFDFNGGFIGSKGVILLA